MLANPDAITAPVLIIHGERDTITPVAQARQLADTLGDLATLITFSDEGHGIWDADNQSGALRAELRHLRRAATERPAGCRPDPTHGWLPQDRRPGAG